MSKNTQSGGSLLMKLLPNFAKPFLESASQEDVLKAEQEAAVLHEKLQSTENKPEVVANVPPTEAPELTAMTTRATTAESRIKELQNQLETATADRDKYKAWHDKQSAGGTKLPAGDSSNRHTTDENQEFSAATSDALEMLRKRRALIA